MDRFDELKAKIKETGGFLGLSKEEQTEYKTLKSQASDTPEPRVDKVEKGNKTEDRLKALEDALAESRAENSNLREESAKLQEGWSDYTPPGDANKTATIKIYRENAEAPAGVIVDAKVFSSTEFDEETRKYDKLIYTITCRYDDESLVDHRIEAELLSQIREIEKVEIIDEVSRTLKKVDGYVPRASTDKEGYPKRQLNGGSGFGHSEGEGEVELAVFMVKSTVTVKRANGQEFEMEADNLNL